MPQALTGHHTNTIQKKGIVAPLTPETWDSSTSKDVI